MPFLKAQPNHLIVIKMQGLVRKKWQLAKKMSSPFEHTCFSDISHSSYLSLHMLMPSFLCLSSSPFNPAVLASCSPKSLLLSLFFLLYFLPLSSSFLHSCILPFPPHVSLFSLLTKHSISWKPYRCLHFHLIFRGFITVSCSPVLSSAQGRVFLTLIKPFLRMFIFHLWITLLQFRVS